MPRKPRLKVYAAAAGFSEAVVAAPSQKAALQAWGARDDYFAHGVARVVDDAETVAAALAQPGVVLKRPVGSAEDFVAAAKPRRDPRNAGRGKPRPESRPDRSGLDAAEAALKAAEDEARHLERDAAQGPGGVGAKPGAARRERAAAVAERSEARDVALDAYRKAGG